MQHKTLLMLRVALCGNVSATCLSISPSQSPKFLNESLASNLRPVSVKSNCAG